MEAKTPTPKAQLRSFSGDLLGSALCPLLFPSRVSPLPQSPGKPPTPFHPVSTPNDHLALLGSPSPTPTPTLAIHAGLGTEQDDPQCRHEADGPSESVLPQHLLSCRLLRLWGDLAGWTGGPEPTLCSHSESTWAWGRTTVPVLSQCQGPPQDQGGERGTAASGGHPPGPSMCRLCPSSPATLGNGASLGQPGDPSRHLQSSHRPPGDSGS